MQKCQIEWSLEALNDFEYYIDWYLQNANIAIASEFVQIIEDVVKKIETNNYIARMANEMPELREYVVQKFPYLISYWIKSPTQIVLTSFLHQKMKK
jgi:plasmid stabilization system protein ParE